MVLTMLSCLHACNYVLIKGGTITKKSLLKYKAHPLFSENCIQFLIDARALIHSKINILYVCSYSMRQYFIAGMVAGCCTVVFAPVDRVKCVMQVSVYFIYL